MNTVEYGGKTYAEKANPSLGADVIIIEHLAGSKLVEIHNVAREACGARGTKRFSDHATGVKRTWKALTELDAFLSSEEQGDTTPAPTPKKAAPKPAAKKSDKPRAKRGMRFVFKPMEETVAPKANTLRAQALDLLKKGATFEQVKQLVADFDAERNKEPWRLEPRAYELVRIVHYYLGYGLKMDDKGVITAYTE